MNEIKEASPCADCGFRFAACAMDFDHRGTDKVDLVGSIVRSPASWDMVQAEIDKCDIVCSNCHRVRTKSRGSSAWTRKRPNCGKHPANIENIKRLKSVADQFALFVMPTIKKAQRDGARSLREIGSVLHAQGIPSANGGLWHAHTVNRLMIRAAKVEAAANDNKQQKAKVA